MKKQLAVWMVALCMVFSVLPVGALAAKQMNDGVPVWNEETVKQYALDFIRGEDLARLRGYYDLQLRRYMPMETYQRLLTELEWMTGDFVEFGTYTSFAEENRKTKTHVLHLCMEKQDLDLYFTHKDKSDDWEVMAVEFIPAEKQAISNDRDMQVGENEEGSPFANTPTYTETDVVVGSAPYELKGKLSMPNSASPTNRVPACVLVHGSGPSDMDETIGQTKLFADIAKAFASKGIAVLRYEKRTYAYGSSMTAEQIANLTVEEETIQDAIAAGNLLRQNHNIDSNKIVVVGHSMGAMLAPRIVMEATGLFKMMILISGTPQTLTQLILWQNEELIKQMDPEAQLNAYEQITPMREVVKRLPLMTEEEARQQTLFGINGYYFWEMEQHDIIQLIRKSRIPTYIVQGNEDFQISVENGVELYEDRIGDKVRFVDYKVYRGLNHLLMRYEGDPSWKGTLKEYDVPAKLDTSAARDIIAWMKNVWAAAAERE